MAINLTAYNGLKEQARAAKDAVSRAEGALEEHMKTLLDDYGCKTVEQAESMLDDMQDELDELEAKAETLMSEFEGKWKERLAQ
jgi:hypothetical protein